LFLSLSSHNAKKRNAGSGEWSGTQYRKRQEGAAHQLGGMDHIIIAFCDQARRIAMHSAPPS
jgi:hypothetical protein